MAKASKPQERCDVGKKRKQPNPWGEKLVKLRDRRGWSNKEFAKILNVNIRTLHAWLYAERTPNGSAQALIDILSKIE